MWNWPKASPAASTSDLKSVWPKVWPNVNLTQSLILGGTSDQRSAWHEVWPNVNLTWSLILGGASDQMSNWSNVVTQLATRCFCLGGISDQRSAWPEVLPNVNLTQSLIWGDVWTNVNLTQSSSTLGHKISLPRGVHLAKGQPDPVWPNVSLTQSLILGGTSDHRSTWPKDLTKMSTWLEASSVGVVHLSAKRLSENLNTLCVSGLASQRSFTKDL